MTGGGDPASPTTGGTIATTTITKGFGHSCDNCRLRKVKCSREQPCGQCRHLDLPCVFSQAPKKRANPVRGRLIAQARDGHRAARAAGGGGPGSRNLPSPVGQQHAHAHHHHQASLSLSGDSSSSPTVYSTTSGGGGGGLHSHSHSDGDPAQWSPGTNQSGNHEFPGDFFLGLLDDFEQVVFPFSPIITSSEITDAIRNMNLRLEDEALVYAYAAVTTYLSNTHGVSQHVHEKDHLNLLVQRGLRTYRHIDLGDPRALKDVMYSENLSSTIKRIITCIFLEISMMAFKSYDRSFTLLRECVGMIQMIETDRRLRPPPQAFAAGGGGGGGGGITAAVVYSSARYQRIYWEVFIHERFLSISMGYPSILPPMGIGVPREDPGIPGYIDVSFRRLIHLFQVLDDEFIEHWATMQSLQNGGGGGGVGGGRTTELTAQWIERKQLQLDQDEALSLQHQDDKLLHSLTTLQHGGHLHTRDENIRALQHVDQYVTRLWLRTLLWQLALSRGLLSSEPGRLGNSIRHEGLSLHFPAKRLSLQLRSLVGRLDSFAAIDTQGTGVLQKLFEITSTIADVMALPLPSSPPPPPPLALVEGPDGVSGEGGGGGGGDRLGENGEKRDAGDGGGEQEARATRMRDFVKLVEFLLRFDRVRREQREYLEDKVRSLGSLYPT